jgi:replicative DNA helicase
LTDMTPPTNVDAERALIASLMIDMSSFPEVAEVVEADDFYHISCRAAYEVLADLAGTVDIPDPILIGERMKRKGAGADGTSFLIDIMASVPSSLNATGYAEVVRDHSRYRKIIKMAQDAATHAHRGEMSPDEVLAFVTSETGELASEDTGLLDAERLMAQSLEKSMTAAERGGVSGITTGFDSLDRLLLRFRRGEFIVPAARPGHGKTALMCSMALRMILRGVRVMFFSGEMRPEDIVNRLIAYHYGSTHVGPGLSSRDIADGRLTDKQWSDVHRIIGEISVLKERLTIRKGSYITPAIVKNGLLEYDVRYGRLPDVVMIDYIGLMGSDEPTRGDFERISSVTRKLKVMTLEMDIVTIAASQLNRDIEKRADKRPLLSDLRSSGTIEQDADRVLFIHRPEMVATEDEDPRHGVAEIIQAKMREGPTAQTELYFSGIKGFKEIDIHSVDLNSDEMWGDQLHKWQLSKAAQTADYYD